MKNSKNHTYSSKYSDEVLLRGKELFEEKAKRELTMAEVLEWTENLVRFGEILLDWNQKEMMKKAQVIERLIRILVFRSFNL